MNKNILGTLGHWECVKLILLKDFDVNKISEMPVCIRRVYFNGAEYIEVRYGSELWDLKFK